MCSVFIGSSAGWSPSETPAPVSEIRCLESIVFDTECKFNFLFGNRILPENLSGEFTRDSVIGVKIKDFSEQPRIPKPNTLQDCPFDTADYTAVLPDCYNRTDGIFNVLKSQRSGLVADSDSCVPARCRLRLTGGLISRTKQK